MKMVDIPVAHIRAAPWNANRLDEPMRRRLMASVDRYGLVQPLVVRQVEGGFETVAGAQRLTVLREKGRKAAPCVVLDDLADADAKVLSLALNRIGGSDDVNALGALAREVLGQLPPEVVADILPQGLDHLKALADLGRVATEGPSLGEALAEREAVWRQAREVAFERISFAVDTEQRIEVEAAVQAALEHVPAGDEPNRRGQALATICGEWRRTQERNDSPLHGAV